MKLGLLDNWHNAPAVLPAVWPRLGIVGSPLGDLANWKFPSGAEGLREPTVIGCGIVGDTFRGLGSLEGNVRRGKPAGAGAVVA